MSLGLDEVTARLDSLKFNAQEKGQLKAQLMKLNSEQLLFLFDDDDVVTATLACMLKDSNKGNNRNGPTNLNNINNPNNNGAPKCRNFNTCQKYCYPNGKGGHFDYCGQTCRQNNSNNNPPKCRNFNICKKFCYPNPNGGYYNYCGKTCRQNNSNNNPPKCRNFNTCKKYCYLDPNDGYYDYCGKTCRQNNSNNNNGAPKCRNFNTCQKYCYPDGKGGHYDYCGKTCRQNNVRSGCVSVLPHGTKDYDDIENQFIDKWEHPNKSKPTIKTILQINVDQKILRAYQSHRDNVESQGKFKGKAANHGSGIMTEGNECRRFHGTAVKCQIGINGNTSLCQDSLCSICQIIQNSFEIKNAEKNFGWSRFGPGIYFSSISSKSDDYVKTNNKTKVMLMAKVVVGKGYKLQQNAQVSLSDLQTQGYHSVIGEVGAVLNYDEVVIYDDVAAIPSYLIVYK